MPKWRILPVEQWVQMTGRPHRIMVVALSLILFALAATTARPVLASGPDFTISASPSSVVMPEGFWADTMLTVSSLNGFQGTVQITLSFGTNVPGLGAGYNTGMYLNAGSQVNTDVMLTAGKALGNYTYTIAATIRGISQNLTLPVTIIPVSKPDFITRLWGSYSILQDWNTTIQEQLTSIGGFQGDVSLTASVSPSLPDAPSVTLQPANILLSPNNAVCSAIFSSNRETPVGNYIVTVSAVSGTTVHTSQALLMVGDYRPPSDRQPGSNSTITNSSTGQSSLQTIYGNIISSVSSNTRSLLLMAGLIGIGVAATLTVAKRLRQRIFPAITREINAQGSWLKEPT